MLGEEVRHLRSSGIPRARVERHSFLSGAQKSTRPSPSGAAEDGDSVEDREQANQGEDDSEDRSHRLLASSSGSERNSLNLRGLVACRRTPVGKRAGLGKHALG